MNFQTLIYKNLLQHGSFIKAIRKTGLLASADFAISAALAAALNHLYKPRNTDYGLAEAFFYMRSVDEFERYSSVLNEIRDCKAEISNVLEIGAGGKGISAFSKLLRDKCDFLLLDLDKTAFNGLERLSAIVGDGCNLPFKDAAFDLIILVDAIEHVPRNLRQILYSEVKRTARKKLIITCPIQSSDNLFQGRNYDMAFQYYFERHNKRREPNTAQHIAAGHPTLKEIKLQFPACVINPYKNCEVWLKYMLLMHKPFVGFLSGIVYYLFWKKNRNRPPYWGATITMDLKAPKNLFKSCSKDDQ